jgi:hypothetical protein
MATSRLTGFSFAMAAALVSVMSIGCYKHVFVIGAGAPTGQMIYDHWENFWIAGLIGEKEVTVAQLCPSGNATIEAKQTFLNGLVSALTSGIYTPTTLRIRCQDGRQAALPLTSEDVERIVSDARFSAWVAENAPDLAGAVRAAQEKPLAH